VGISPQYIRKDKNNMKFPRLKKIYVRGIGFVEVRPYLTTNEISAIINTIQAQTTDYAMRIMMMYSMVMPLCTNLKDFTEEEIDIEVVEKYYLNGIFDRITKHIKGFDILSNGVEKLAVSDVYKQFESVIEEFTKQFKDVNLDEQQKKFEDTLNELRHVEAEKEAILNG
jgi:hypothetical protein